MKRTCAAAEPHDPPRLSAGATGAMLKRYAAWTRPGDSSTVTAWYRLQDAEARATPSRASGRRPRTFVLSAVLTASFASVLLMRALPASPPTAEHGAPIGGAPGESAPAGAGGTRGTSGTQGAGGTAATTLPPRRAG